MPAAARGGISCTCCRPATKSSPATPARRPLPACRRWPRRTPRTCRAHNFRVEPVEAMAWPDHFADVVISNAVLHFARDDAAVRGHGAADVGRPEAWRHDVLPPGVHHRHGTSGTAAHRVAGTVLPDGSERYLVDEALLMALTARLGGVLLDPLKTTVVQDQRSMTTWVVRKGSRSAAAIELTCGGRPAAARRSRDRTWPPASPWSCRYRAAG